MSYEPKPSLPRPIHSPVDHYDVDVATGTVTYHVVTTNADRIRAMSDEDLAEWICVHITECSRCEGGKMCESRNGHFTGLLRWLKSPAEVS